MCSKSGFIVVIIKQGAKFSFIIKVIAKAIIMVIKTKLLDS